MGIHVSSYSASLDLVACWWIPMMASGLAIDFYSGTEKAAAPIPIPAVGRRYGGVLRSRTNFLNVDFNWEIEGKLADCDFISPNVEFLWQVDKAFIAAGAKRRSVSAVRVGRLFVVTKDLFSQPLRDILPHDVEIVPRSKDAIVSTASLPQAIAYRAEMCHLGVKSRVWSGLSIDPSTKSDRWFLAFESRRPKDAVELSEASVFKLMAFVTGRIESLGGQLIDCFPPSSL